MRTLIEILKLSTTYLQQHHIQNPQRHAEDLICDALGIHRLQIYQEFDRPLNESELELCRCYLGRRAKGEPMPYIKGEMEFYGCKIFLNKDVLIPRQETEILVDMIAKQLEKENLEGKCLWDVCCGSGCIGIALKKKFPLLKVLLSDNSEEALKVAKKNALANEVEVDFLQGDLLQPFAGRKANYFVSNPPYVTENEFFNLDPEVKDFEPQNALIAGPNGWEFYARLAHELREFLTIPAKAWFEIGNTQGLIISEIFKNAGWKTFEVKKDWAGHDRFFFLENESFFDYSISKIS